MENLTKKTGKDEVRVHLTEKGKEAVSKFSTKSVRASCTLEDAVKRILILELRQQKMEAWCEQQFDSIKECLDDLGEEEWQQGMKKVKSESDSPDEEEY